GNWTLSGLAVLGGRVLTGFALPAGSARRRWANGAGIGRDEHVPPAGDGDRGRSEHRRGLALVALRRFLASLTAAGGHCGPALPRSAGRSRDDALLRFASPCVWRPTESAVGPGPDGADRRPGVPARRAELQRFHLERSRALVGGMAGRSAGERQRAHQG